MRGWLSPIARSLQRPHPSQVGYYPGRGVAPWLALFGVAMILYVVSTAVYLEFARLLPRAPSQTAATAESENRLTPPDVSSGPGSRPSQPAEAGTQIQFAAASDDTRGAAAAEIPAQQPAAGRRRSAAGYGLVAATPRQRPAAADVLARQETLRILYTDILQERARLIELQQQLARRPQILARRAGDPRQQANAPDETVSTPIQPVPAAATFVSRTQVPARPVDSLKPLDPETAARSLQHLIRTGNDAVALNLLRGFSEQQAAKILARLWQQEPVAAKDLAQQLNRARAPAQ